jgi:hypothetical protein
MTLTIKTEYDFLFVTELMEKFSNINQVLFLLSVGPAVLRLMYCRLPRLILLNPLWFPLSGPEMLHVKWRERPLTVKDRTMGEQLPISFTEHWRLTRNCRILLHASKLQYVTYGLLPIRRKECRRIFRPKNPTAFCLV